MVTTKLAMVVGLCGTTAIVRNAAAYPPDDAAYSVRALNDTSDAYPFLSTWETNYLSAGPTGCVGANTGHWNWRVSGLGCNMNQLLTAYRYWVYGWDWGNLAVIIGEHFDRIECTSRASGVDVKGWHCIFQQMPHICTFRTVEEYTSFLTAEGASFQTVNASLQIQNKDTWHDPRNGRPYPGFRAAPHPSELDAREMVSRHMWKYLQPWVTKDVQTLNACLPAGVREGPYVALHIRRGDKLKYEAKLVPTEKYLNLTKNSLVAQHKACADSPLELEMCQGRSHALPHDIRGIYVASDDNGVVDEVRNLLPEYFPNIAPDEVVFLSDGKANCTLGVHEIATRVYKQDYMAMAYLLHDIDRMVKADLFVGTFSSNLGRFIGTLRKTVGSFGVEANHQHWKPN